MERTRAMLVWDRDAGSRTAWAQVSRQIPSFADRTSARSGLDVEDNELQLYETRWERVMATAAVTIGTLGRRFRSRRPRLGGMDWELTWSSLRSSETQS